jgi:hypothetical protein
MHVIVVHVRTALHVNKVEMVIHVFVLNFIQERIVKLVSNLVS